jgi:hypothetical protein
MAVPLVADGGNDGPLRPVNDVRPEAQAFDAVDHVFDLLLAGALFHDDDHRLGS